MTATPEVPPPTSTTIRPTGSPMSIPAPIAAARDSSIRWTSRAPALNVASSTARRSTSVMPDGAQMTIRGREKRLCSTLPRNWRSIASVTSKSAITPWRNGRSAEIVAGVRPIIRWASAPTAWTSPVRWSIATTEGSDNTMPRPRTYTSVFAVPRSTAMSRPPKPLKLSRNPIGAGDLTEVPLPRLVRAAPHRSGSPESVHAGEALGEEPDEQGGGQADDVQVVALDPLDEGGAAALDGVAARAALPFEGRLVGRQVSRRERPERHRRVLGLDHLPALGEKAQAGDDVVRAARKCVQHLHRAVGARGLAVH